LRHGRQSKKKKAKDEKTNELGKEYFARIPRNWETVHAVLRTPDIRPDLCREREWFKGVGIHIEIQSGGKVKITGDIGGAESVNAWECFRNWPYRKQPHIAVGLFLDRQNNAPANASTAGKA
jgi:hypothetical protein